MTSFDHQVSNQIVARIIHEVHLDTLSLVSASEIRQHMLKDDIALKEIRRTQIIQAKEKGHTPTEDTAAGQYIKLFAEMFDRIPWRRLLKRTTTRPYQYKPIYNSTYIVNAMNSSRQLIDIKNSMILSQNITTEDEVNIIIDLQPTSDLKELEERTNRLLRLKNLLPRPKSNQQPVKQKIQTSTVYERSPSVRAWVLQESRGICELCDQEGPFYLSNGNIFLEVHHVKSISEGGFDITENAVAVCPNCHRKLHYSTDSLLQKDKLYKKVPRLIRY